MARPKIPSQKKAYAQLRGRINQYTLLVQQVYDQLNKEVASMVTRLGYDGSKPFRFSDYPQTSKAVRDLQEKFVGNLHSVIYTSTSREWKESNLLQDLLADKAMKFYGIKTRKGRIKKYYQTNSDALKAFQDRKDKGLNLSQKLWNQSEDYKKELECAISSAVQKGTSAIALSKRLSKYLNDFPSLKADYGKRFGKARDVKDCEYRSIRLARTEINMAYRTAEQMRWEQFDFVIGYEVKLSGGHKIKDICDFAKGKYPKKFKFKGWHPNCFCYVIPILKSEDEFWDESGAPCPSEVVDTPDGFKNWIKDNSDRLSEAKKKGTLPYWAEENTDYVFAPVKSKMPKQYEDAFAYAREHLSDIERDSSRRWKEVSLDKLQTILSDKDNLQYILENGYRQEEYILMDIQSSGEIGIDMLLQDIKKMNLPHPLPDDLIGHTATLATDSMLPNDFEKIRSILNNSESLEQFYISHGYKTYEEFFDAIGGRKYIEAQLSSMAEQSSVYMCIDGSTLEKKIILGDGRFKNSLETGKGSFKTIGEERAIKERMMFGLEESADYNVMPKYGFMAGKETMDYEEIVGFGYGDSYVKFKDASVMRRTTITCGDSYDGNRLVRGGTGYGNASPATPLQNPDANFSIGMLNKRGDATRVATFLKEGKQLSEFVTGTYIEAQIYGELDMSAVDTILLSSKKRAAAIEKALKKKGYDVKVAPLQYDTRLKAVEGFGKDWEKVQSSLSLEDVDNLGEFYIDCLTKRFADPRNGWWKEIKGKIEDSFFDDMNAIFNGGASYSVKRNWLKRYYTELEKRDAGAFPKVWWSDRKKTLGGWTSDCLNEKLLKRKS